VTTVSPPDSIESLCELIRNVAGPVIPCGAGTKPKLTEADATRISLRSLSGITEYEPSEYTFTALAGTPLREISKALARHGQYLPFDPVLEAAGATLGGTIAAAAHGPGRVRFGGVRDFCIGVRFVDGQGRLLRGGGKVVKNAAGFDFPKLFCGSLGRLGILAEVSMKVFPAPQQRLTAVVTCRNTTDALERLAFAARQSWDVEALEVMPPRHLDAQDTQFVIRLLGHAAGLAERMQHITQALARPSEILTDFAATMHWNDDAGFGWVPQQASLMRIPLTANAILPLLSAMPGQEIRISMAGNLALVAWAGDAATLHSILTKLDLGAICWKSPHPDFPCRLGTQHAARAEEIVKQTMDPSGKFSPMPPALA
jgi:glycolate oxidase FAD binding subunit